MARKRQSPESIAKVLRQVESGIPIAELARKTGVHENTIHLWKKKYGSLGTPEIREINELRDENTRLKRLVADLTLDKVMLQDVLSKKALEPAKQRALAGELQEEYGASQRRICETMRFNRASMRYKPKVNPINEALRARIKEISQARVRYGYRRIHVLLPREGWKVNHKRICRIYTQEGLSLRAKAPKRRRRSAVMRVRIAATQPNHVWCMDFMHDRLVGDARKAFRLLTIIDIFTRECLALEVATGFRARDVVEILTRLVGKRGAPIAIRCDQGTEFTAEALDQWAYNNRIELDFSRPGKPTDNAFAESFNASVRKELLNTSWFDTLEMARRAARAWRKDYNEVRPHRSLANKTPNDYAASAKSAT